MRNDAQYRLSTSALVIAILAVTATARIEAQCPGGCFGYPTPNRSTTQSFTTSAQYSSYPPSLQMAPAQTIIQRQPLAALPQFTPLESFAPTQTFYQPPQLVQPQLFAPSMMPPMQQTFVAQPAIVAPTQMLGTSQYPPQPVAPASPANSYYSQPDFAMPGGTAEPMTWHPISPIVSETDEPAENMSGEAEEKPTERVQEGEIEGVIISPANDASDSVTPKETQEQQEEIPLIQLTDATDGEDAEKKAVEERAAEKEVERLEAEKVEATKLKAEEKKAAEMKATEAQKVEQKAKDMAEPKVLSNTDKITRLETSLRRQISRAKRVAARDLPKQLTQLENDGASTDQIAAAEKKAAEALQKEIETIQARIKARIKKLKD